MEEQVAHEMTPTAKKRRISVPGAEWIEELLPSWVGCGPKKRRALAQRFSSEAELRRASFEDLRVPPVGLVVAERVRDFLHGKLSSPKRSDGRPVIEMWNKVSKRKLPYPSCPKSEEEAKTFMQKYDYYELYNGQDREDCAGDDDVLQLSREQYSDFCREPAVKDGKQKLEYATRNCKTLQLGPFYEEGATSGSAARLSTVPLFEAIAHANMAYGGGVAARELQAVVRADSTTPLVDVLDAAADELRRPIRILLAGQIMESVYLAEGTGSAVFPPDTPPIRLGHAGGMIFAPIFPADDPIPAPVTQYQDVDDDEITPNKQLYELKTSLSQGVERALECVEGIQAWSTNVDHGHEVDLGMVHEQSKGFLSRLRSADGLTGAVLGTNGNGKSTLLNLMLLNSSIDPQAYAETFHTLARDDETYIPEAIRYAELDVTEELPSLKELYDARKEPYDANESEVMMLPRQGAEPKMQIHLIERLPALIDAGHTPVDMISRIKSFCETKQFSGFTDFIFPCGNGVKTTTIMGTCVRYGQIVQLLIQRFSELELKAQAFEFVSLLGKHVEDLSEPEELDYLLETKQRSELLEAFKKYLLITSGDADADERQMMEDIIAFASDIDALPSDVNSVTVSDTVCDMVKVPQIVYVGTGNLSRDHAVLSSLIEKSTNDDLHILITKRIQLYEPVALLEGGTGLVDLPGTNTMGAAEIVHTKKGVEEAGVIFVVLKKELGSDESSAAVLEESGVLKRVLLERPSNPVVFLFNREMQEQSNLAALEEKMGSDEEKKQQMALKECTQKIWKDKLSREAGRMYGNGELSQKITADEIQEIVDRTPMRCIYPMLHTAWKLHTERAAACPEVAERVFANSNIYWLLGLLEKLNRDDIIDELRTLASKTLPEAADKVMASINDAQLIGDAKLPAGLVQMAHKMLTGTRNEGFTRTMDQLRKKVQEMCAENTELRSLLDGARAKQAQMWTKVEKVMNKSTTSFQSLLQFISIRNGGKISLATTGISIHSMVFGKERPQLDFAPLHGEIKKILDHMKEKVIDLLLEVLDEHLKISRAQGGASADQNDQESTVQLLRETFQHVNLLPMIEARFGNDFFARKQTKVDLIYGRIPKFFSKLANEAASTALHQEILKQSTNLKSKQEISSFFQENEFARLESARSRWLDAELANSVVKFLVKQFKELEKDLVSKMHKKGPQGLLERLLRAFFSHVVQIAKAQNDGGYVAEVKANAKELRERGNELYTLWAQVGKQTDPEELGKEATRYFERMRGQQACNAALSAYRLHRPNRSPVASIICEDDVQHTFYTKKQHTFLFGDINSLATMSKQLKLRYGLKLLKSEAGRSDYVFRKDIFSAAALLCWNQVALCKAAGLQPLDERHLRALAVKQLEEHLKGKSGRRARCAADIGQDMNEYLQVIQTPEYPGDLFCLWAIAKQVNSNIRVWLPGDEQKRCILLDGVGYNAHQACAFNMVIVRDPDDIDVASPRSKAKKWFLPVFKNSASLKKSVSFSNK